MSKIETKKYTWSDNQTDEIWYNDRFNTIEECVKDAIKQGKQAGDKIVIGVCEDYVPHINVDTLLDVASEDAYEEVGEVADNWLEYTIHEGYKDADKLQGKINQVFTEWLEETKQVPGFYKIEPLADMITIPEEECRMFKKSRKPKDIEEVEKFIFDKLKEEYGDNVISEKPPNTIVIDTKTKYYGNSDVWIELNYFC